jgi:protein phosphatase 1 regulatory subunit 7
MEAFGEPNDPSQNVAEESVDKEIETNELIVLDPDATEVDFNHGRIAKIENLECLTQVEGLYLRWNLIKKIENIGMLSTLRELELYDNQITEIEKLGSLVNIE